MEAVSREQNENCLSSVKFHFSCRILQQFYPLLNFTENLKKKSPVEQVLSCKRLFHKG